MSDEKADILYGRLCREVRELTRTSALLESSLKRFWFSLEEVGRKIQVFDFNIDKTALEKDWTELWDTISKYKQIASLLVDKRAQLDKIDFNG